MHVKDEKHPIYLFENFFEEERSIKLLEFLKKNIEWGRDTYKFGDKEVKSPRLIYYFGNKPYNYSGQIKEPVPFTKEIQYLSYKIEDYLTEYIEDNISLPKGYFNGCLLNWYRDGKDSISYHTDDEDDMVDDGIIAVLTIGVTRNFYVKNNQSKEVIKTPLPSGSLAVMNPICQIDYKHAILKEPKIEGERISLTFRRFKK